MYRTLQNESLTTLEYSAFDAAYRYFNGRLFGSALPDCLITLQRKARANGYYSHKRFEARAEGGETDEIALNPAHFKGRSDAEILSTLAHEMVHLWQYHYGSPGRNRYHNREWAARMEALGLMPSDTGRPGGKRTGQRMTHYIVAGGDFDVAARELLATGYRLNWQSRESNGTGGAPKNKTKYQCPACGLNAWAKPDAHLVCGECNVRMGDGGQ